MAEFWPWTRGLVAIAISKEVSASVCCLGDCGLMLRFVSSGRNRADNYFFNSRQIRPQLQPPSLGAKGWLSD